MGWTRRKLMILYCGFLTIIFLLSGMLSNNENQVMEFEILCDNGSIERFNFSDEYICGGHENPLRKNMIEVNFSSIVEKLNNN